MNPDDAAALPQLLDMQPVAVRQVAGIGRAGALVGAAVGAWVRARTPSGEFDIEYIHLHEPTLNTPAMSQSTTMTVRLNPTLSDFVAANVSEDGPYHDVSEYVRDLIRRDMERKEQEALDRLKAELSLAFAAPEASFATLSAAEVIARNAAKPEARAEG